MFWREKPKYKLGMIVSLHNGGYVVIKGRRWARFEGRRQWVYRVVRLLFDKTRGDLNASPHEDMSDYSLKWEVLTS